MVRGRRPIISRRGSVGGFAALVAVSLLTLVVPVGTAHALSGDRSSAPASTAPPSSVDYRNSLGYTGLSAQLGWLSAAVASNNEDYPTIVSYGVDEFNEVTGGTGSTYFVGASDSVWVVINWWAATATNTPIHWVRDNRGDSYTLAKEILSGPDLSGAVDDIALYYADNVSAGPLQVSFSLPFSWVAMATLVLSGAATPSVGSVGSGGDNSWSPQLAGGPVNSTLTTTNGSELAFYFVGAIAAAIGAFGSFLSPTWVPGSGLSLLTSGGNPSDPGSLVGVMWERVPVSGTLNLTATFAATSNLQLGPTIPANSSIFVAVEDSCTIASTLAVTDQSGNGFVVVASSRVFSPHWGTLQLWESVGPPPKNSWTSLFVTNDCQSFSVMILVATGQSSPFVNVVGTSGNASSFGTFESQVTTTEPNETLLLLVASQAETVYAGLVSTNGSNGSSLVGILAGGNGDTMAAFASTAGSPGPSNISGTVIGSPKQGQGIWYLGVGLSDVPVSSVEEPVTFTEVGLPPGVSWAVDLGPATYGTSNQSVVVAEPNGSYAYGAEASNASYAATGGRFVVNGTAVSVVVGFAQATYTVTFNESELPAPILSRSGWTVTLDGATVHSLEKSVRFQVAPAADQPYLVDGPAGYDVSDRLSAEGPFGNVTVDRSSVTDVFTFAKGPTYTLTVHASGLAKGRAWCVALQGATECSATPNLQFRNLTPAFYPYAVVSPLEGQTILGRLGGTVLGGSGGTVPLIRTETVDLTFAYRYAVTFTEAGLGSGAWSVTVQGVKESNGSGGPIVFELVNGTYGYRIGTETGYTSAGVPRAVVVAGTADVVYVSFHAKGSRAG